MADLTWSVKLDDKMSKSAQAAAKSVGKLGDAMKGLKSAAAGVTTAGAKLSAFQRIVQFTGRNFGTGGVNALMGAARGAVAAGDKMSAVWSKIGPAVTTAGSAALGAAAAIAALGVAATASALQGAMAFGESKAQTLFAFEKLLGSGHAAAKAWDAVTAAARKTKTPISEVAASINAMLAAGFDLPTAETLFKQLADLKTLNPQANLEGIVRAISQIKNTGKLQGDELLQLAEAGVNVDDVYKALEQRLGKTREEILKLQAAGKISSKDAIAAIQEAISKKTGKAPGEVAAQAPKTAAETLQRLKEQFFDLVNLDFGPIQSFLGKLESALDGKGGRALASSLEKLFKALGQGLDSLTEGDINAIMVRVASSIDGVTGAVKSTTDALTFLGEMFGETSGRATVLIGVFEGIRSIAWLAFNTFIQIATGGIPQLISAFDSLWPSISSVAEELWDAAASLGSDIIDGIVAGIEGAAGAVADAVKGAASSALDAGRDVLGIASPSKEFAKIGRWSMEGMAQGVNHSAPSMSYAVAERVGTAASAGARAAQNVVNNTSTNNSRSVSTGPITVNGQSDPKGTASMLESLFRSFNFAGA